MKFSYTIIFVILSGINSISAQWMDSTNLPLFIIETNNETIVDEPKINVKLKVIYNEIGYNLPEDSANIYDGDIGIEIRGRYSASLPQKPFGIETRNSLGENLNVPLFHMPEENDWILLANYNDKTFLRNSLTFELFRKMGHYAPRTQYCEVLINGFYQGIYVFTEKIKRDSSRVAVSKLTPDENEGENLTGGYIFKVDYYTEQDSWISQYPPIGSPDKEVRFVFEYPKPEEITSDQIIYLQGIVNDFETTLYTTNDYGITEAVSSYIDVNSFVDYFLLNELARNVDGYKKSSFFHKHNDKKGGLIHAGPVWDFDWAWKNINECYFGATDGSGWAFRVHDCDPWPVPPTWISTLLRDPHFKLMVNNRYAALRSDILSEESIFNYIDSTASVLDEAQFRHFRKWQILGVNVGTPETDAQPLTYAGEIEKFKNWISTRLNWLDSQIPFHVVTAIDENTLDANSNHDFNIYPNPASNQLTVKSNQAINAIRIYSLNGILISNEFIPNENEFTTDVSSLPKGFYSVMTEFHNGSKVIRKLVKQ